MGEAPDPVVRHGAVSVTARTPEVSPARQTRTEIWLTVMSLSITQYEEHTMSKSLTLSRARHSAAAVVGLLVSLAAICAAAPAAFARPLAPPDGSGTAASVAGHSGTPGWEIALIAIGAVMLIGLLVAVVLRRRSSVRLQRAVS